MRITQPQLIRLRGEARRLGYPGVTDLALAAGVPAKDARNISYLDSRDASAVISQCTAGTVPPYEVPEVPAEALRSERARLVARLAEIDDLLRR